MTQVRLQNLHLQEAVMPPCGSSALERQAMLSMLWSSGSRSRGMNRQGRAATGAPERAVVTDLVVQQAQHLLQAHDVLLVAADALLQVAVPRRQLPLLLHIARQPLHLRIKGLRLQQQSVKPMIPQSQSVRWLCLEDCMRAGAHPTSLH